MKKQQKHAIMPSTSLVVFAKKHPTRVKAIPVVAVAVIGIITLLISQAATSVVSFQAEANAPTSMVIDSTTASGGKAVRFVPAPVSGSGYGPRIAVGLTTAEVSLPVCQASGSTFSTSSNGQIIQNCKMTQSWLDIKHSAVTFRNVLFLQGTNTGGQTHLWSSSVFDTVATAGVRFENVEFRDILPVLGSADPARPAVLKASLLHGTSDGYGDVLKGGSNILIEDSILRNDYKTICAAGSHGDGIQSDFGEVDNVTVRYTYIEQLLQNCPSDAGTNGCLFENQVGDHGEAPPQNWLFENNELKCNGGYSVRLSNISGTQNRNLVIRNNKIHRTFGSGPVLARDNTGRASNYYTWSGNVDETGKAL